MCPARLTELSAAPVRLRGLAGTRRCPRRSGLVVAEEAEAGFADLFAEEGVFDA